MKEVKYKSVRGAALITSLIMVLVIAILGIAVSHQVIALRKVTTENYDQTLSFNSAESALSAANNVVADNALDSATLLSLTSPLNAANNWWQNSSNWSSATTLNNAISEGNIAPSYIIEDAGIDSLEVGSSALKKRFYRVTVKAQGKGESVAYLQNYYIVLE